MLLVLQRTCQVITHCQTDKLYHKKIQTGKTMTDKYMQKTKKCYYIIHNKRDKLRKVSYNKNELRSKILVAWSISNRKQRLNFARPNIIIIIFLILSRGTIAIMRTCDWCCTLEILPTYYASVLILLYAQCYLIPKTL